jgi:hypothetical protein
MCLLAFHSSIGLAPEIRGGGSGLREETCEDWLNQGAEDNLGAVRHWEGHPEDQDKFEDVVECYRNVSAISHACRSATYGTSKQH